MPAVASRRCPTISRAAAAWRPRSSSPIRTGTTSTRCRSSRRCTFPATTSRSSGPSTDTTYTDEAYPGKVGWGHSGIGQVVELADRAAVKDLHLFHHDPDQNDDDIDRKLASAVAQLARLGSKTRCLAPGEGSNFTY